ncbi:MAG: cytochrome c oxidase subunit III, partial [Saprospiraceae bacterium]
MEKQQDNLIFHPYNVMLFLLLAGLSFLFLALTVGYCYIRVTKGVPPVRVPWLFFFNTGILLTGSYAMIAAKRCYLNDDTAGYQRQLRSAIGLSLLFMAMQGVAWYWLFQINDVGMRTSTTAGFLYVLSIAHFAHVVAGVPFLAVFYRTALRRMVDPVT